MDTGDVSSREDVGSYGSDSESDGYSSTSDPTSPDLEVGALIPIACCDLTCRSLQQYALGLEDTDSPNSKEEEEEDRWSPASHTISGSEASPSLPGTDGGRSLRS